MSPVHRESARTSPVHEQSAGVNPGHKQSARIKILVATGASGGHIFPAFSFCDELRQSHPDVELMLVMPERAHAEYADIPGVHIRRLPIESVPEVFCRRGVVAIFRFLKSTALCVTLVAGFRPQVVVGFGSLASIPALLCAWGFRVPTLVHEQNVVPGRANLFLSAFVDKIAVSFPQSRPFFRAAGRKVVYTGNPLRRWLKAIDKSSARAFFHLQPSTFTVLVTGGSQGSQRINAVAQEALAQARQRAPLQVIHLTGQRDYQQIRKRYDAIMPDAVVVPFLGQMHYAYSAADLVIGRAGATTIAEIISFSLPAILIPYPFAHGHQEANARVLEKAGCALVVGDADLRRDDLSNKIGLCLQHGELLARMTESCRSLQSVNSAGLLVKAAMALAR